MSMITWNPSGSKLQEDHEASAREHLDGTAVDPTLPYPEGQSSLTPALVARHLLEGARHASTGPRHRTP